MDISGHHNSRSGAFLLSLLVLLGSAQATPRPRHRHSARAAPPAFVANGHTVGGIVLGRTRARRATQHRHPHQHLSGGALDSRPRRRCGRIGQHHLRPPSSLGRAMMSAVDEEEQRADEHQQEGQRRFSESGSGGLSRASFVQAAAGSAAAVLALSMVSYRMYIECTRMYHAYARTTSVSGTFPNSRADANHEDVYMFAPVASNE